MDFSLLLKFFPQPLRELILADDISDVMIYPEGHVVVDRNGHLELAEGVSMEPGHLIIAIQNVARLLGTDIDESHPILDTRLPDGSRVAAVYAQGRMTVTIRKFNRWYSTDELVEAGCLPEFVCQELVAGLLGRNYREKANVLVSGGTGAGKSTLAKALIDWIPADERLIVIEKPRELALSHPFAVRWEATDGAPGGATAISVAQWVVAALRHRPDRIIIGEVREPLAAYELLQALNTGHSGSIATIHADSAEDALYRLTDLALASHSNLAHEFVERRVRRSIDYVVHIARRPEGRRVTEVLEVGKDGEAQTLYRREFDREKELAAWS